MAAAEKSVKGAMRELTSNPAIEALARTDDILALIGIIILAGIIVSAYGAFWQGVLSKAQYQKDYQASETNAASAKRKWIIIGGSVLLLLIIAAGYYVMTHYKGKKTGSGAEAIEAIATPGK